EGDRLRRTQADVMGRLERRSDAGDVAELGRVHRGKREAVLVVVPLDTLVAQVLHVGLIVGRYPVLELAGPAELRVEAIVAAGRRDEELGVHRATEPLVAVVEADVRLGVVPGGAVAHAVQRDAVELVVRRELLPGELEAEEVDDAARVVRVGAAEGNAGEAFREALASRPGDRRLAVDGEATPVTDLTRA